MCSVRPGFPERHGASEEAGPLTFRLGEHPEEQISPAVLYLMAARGARRWYLAGNDYCWPWAVHGRARRTIADAGGVVVGESFSPLGARSFDPLIQSIDRSGAEIVLSTFVGSDLIEFTRRFNDSGLRSRCALFSPGMEDFLRDHAGDSAAGAWAMWGNFKDLPTPENRAFLTRYQTRYGELAPAPSGISEAAYEAVHFVSDAGTRGRWMGTGRRGQGARVGLLPGAAWPHLRPGPDPRVAAALPRRGDARGLHRAGPPSPPVPDDVSPEQVAEAG